MADGPAHYKEAERLLAAMGGLRDQIKDLVGESRNATEAASLAAMPMQVIAEAQVHATLALAAATAELDADEGPGGGSATGRDGLRGRAWTDAFGPQGEEQSRG